MTDTKSLRSGYKNPQSIAHKVLADRMTARDPGNKPGPGDRIPFAYIATKDKKALQGDKIETIEGNYEQHIKGNFTSTVEGQIDINGQQGTQSDQQSNCK